MIYISTDYVFDGTKPPYVESDEPNPLNTYGKTKLEGEKATLETSQGNWKKLRYASKYLRFVMTVLYFRPYCLASTHIIWPR